MVGLVYGYLPDEFDSNIHIKNKQEYMEFWKQWKDFYMKRIYKIDFSKTKNKIKIKLDKLPYEKEWNDYITQNQEDYDVYSDEFKIEKKYKFKRDLITSNLGIEVKPYGHPMLSNFIVCNPSYIFSVELSIIKPINIKKLSDVTPSLSRNLIRFLVDMGAKESDIKCDWYLINNNSYYTMIS